MANPDAPRPRNQTELALDCIYLVEDSEPGWTEHELERGAEALMPWLRQLDRSVP